MDIEKKITLAEKRYGIVLPVAMKQRLINGNLAFGAFVIPALNEKGEFEYAREMLSIPEEMVRVAESETEALFVSTDKNRMVYRLNVLGEYSLYAMSDLELSWRMKAEEVFLQVIEPMPTSFDFTLRVRVVREGVGGREILVFAHDDGSTSNEVVVEGLVGEGKLLADGVEEILGAEFGVSEYQLLDVWLEDEEVGELPRIGAYVLLKEEPTITLERLASRVEWRAYGEN